MTLLRMLRNVAVLVILTVAALSLNPRPVAAQSSCQPLGTVCTSTAQCCTGHLRWCSPYVHRCCLPLHNQGCTKSTDCCSGTCLPYGGCA
jgi:hypothetical protein